MARKGITVYLPRELEEEVQKLAKAEHRSDSSIIAEAVRMRFRRRVSNDAPEDSAQRDASRLDARFNKVIGEALILKETLLLFIHIWLKHNPPLDEAIEDSAEASAEARFERFLDAVAQALQPGGSIANGELATAPVGAAPPAESAEARP